MARKIYPYSLDSKDAKIAGVCSTLGDRFGIDPTFIRIAWVAIPLLTPVSFVQAIIAYAIVGIVLAVQKTARDDRREADERLRPDGDGVETQAHGPRDAHRARRDRPPADGDRSPHQHPERRTGARDREAARGEEEK